MAENRLYIKNMVCSRCILVVTDIFHVAGITDAKVQMGQVSFNNPIPAEMYEKIKYSLNNVGFEIINNEGSKLVEQIKKIIIASVYNTQVEMKVNFSTFLSNKLQKDYNYLSSLFSSVEGITIERYIISLKIEKVKELLVYGDNNLSEIAYQMGYSSVAHLSGQFKKITGFTPSYFKKIGIQKRKPIDNI